MTSLLSKTWTSCPSELADIRRHIREACTGVGFTEEATNAIVLAIDEACTNIMRYAYDNCTDGVINVSVEKDDEKVRFILHDLAAQVSKDCIKVKESSILEPGGLGLVLINQVMDSVEFTHTPKCKGNILEMTKALPDNTAKEPTA